MERPNAWKTYNKTELKKVEALAAEYRYIIGEPADDVGEHVRLHHDLTGSSDICFDGGGNANGQVIAADGQAVARPEQQAVEGLDGAFLCSGLLCNIDGGFENRLFTRKFHIIHLSVPSG